MTASQPTSTFLNGANAAYLAELHARYLEQGDSAVDPSWVAFFRDLKEDPKALDRDIHGASWTPRVALPEDAANVVPLKRETADVEDIQATILDSIRALMLIRAYRVRGHLEAMLDPLGLEKREHHPELDPTTYGFRPRDYERPIFVGGVLGFTTATLAEIMQALRATYCGTAGVEFMHIQNPTEKAWIQDRIETIHNQTEFSLEGRKAILERLTHAEEFERFLQVKYTGTKWFGIEGSEAVIPALEQILKRGGQLGVKEAVFGMAHRGRLNVLANVLGKQISAIFSEFQGNSVNPEDVQGSGDVKYHLGTSSDRDFNGNVIHLSLTANPSHLEAVDPVVLGKVRAKQTQLGDTERSTVLGILIHGDAAMAGQGVIAECLALSDLKGYRTGGTVHLVINNQIGFTTAPIYSRSGPYSTDVAKMIQAPIFHVNGDDPEAVVHVSRIATEFRQEFKKDVVIDIVCYRRRGHNEGDEPAFTQPLMYAAIRDQVSTRQLYANQLIKEGVVSEEEAAQMADAFHQRLEKEFAAANSYKPNKADWLEGKWTGFSVASADDRRGATGVANDQLQEVGKVLAQVPDGFNINPKIARQLKAKEQMFKSGQGLDWSTAEALAFGTLVAEGYPVRLSGQDSGRGTFSQRHAVVYDQETEERYVALTKIRDNQAPFEVVDSPLSENAVLGFEYGFTLAEPRALVLWEAQFGDFVNGAQVIIDQFISSAEAKWLRMSGLVMLLPHGYEGQGPEHSSARPERFLQLCGEDNMQVANCTTPANYFHILRRQMHRPFRKPLILMTPKSLLRHKLAMSSLADFATGTTFHRVLPETTLKPSDVKRVVLCSGKVYYDLLEQRQERKLTNVALVRLEQLYPFPAEALATELARFPNADIFWVQEEPQNMGAWFFVDRRIESVLTQIDHAAKRPSYVGRPEGAAPATGLLRRHNAEQAKLVDEALTLA